MLSASAAAGGNMEENDNASDDRPKSLKTVTTWIGGLTGVVIALAGLRAAYNELTENRSGQPVQAANVENAAGDENAADQAAADEPATPAALPLSYTSDGQSLDWTDGHWVVTPDEGDATEYEQMGGRDDGFTYAATADRTAYLRWPNEGGNVETSEDNKYWAFAFAVEPAKDDQAAE
jgi:hypothetical protein